MLKCLCILIIFINELELRLESKIPKWKIKNDEKKQFFIKEDKKRKINVLIFMMILK